jgi:hypothetical protein
MWAVFEESDKEYYLLGCYALYSGAGPQGITLQKTVLLLVTAMKTSNLTKQMFI